MHWAGAAIVGAIMLPGSAAAGSCETYAGPLIQVDQAVRAVEFAWTQMDTAGVQSGEADILDRVACVDRPMSADLIARVHRSMGLVAVTRGDTEVAARAFEAARLTSEDVKIGDNLAPPGSPVARLYKRPIQALPSVPVPPPRRGTLLVNGVEGTELPGGRPLVMQNVARNGSILGSWWLESAVLLPEEPWADPNAKARGATRYGGLIAAGLGGVALGIAGASQSAHSKPGNDRTEAQLVNLRDASRAGTIAGVGLIAVGGAAFGLSFSGPLQ